MNQHAPKHDLLFELGTEELPPGSLQTLSEALLRELLDGLAARELEHGEARCFATPRRLAVLVQDVAALGPDKHIEQLGPALQAARDASGAWTQAALGFARKQGVAPEALELIDTAKGQRLGVRRTEPGAQLRECLNALLNDSVRALPIAKRMRWGASRVEFVRPVHWVVAMLDEEAGFGEVLGVASGKHSRGHRVHSNRELLITRPRDYEQILADAQVVADFARRRQMICEQVEEEASALGATAVIDPALLDEVTALVEWPVALTGNFERRFLEVPQEALISSMKEHQKYFHVVDEHGQLLPHFITVSNIRSRDPAQVIAGNERVIRPRLSDAAFFYEQDRQTPLAERVNSLRDVVFQQQLGTLHDKSQRMVALAAALAPHVGAPAAQSQRAALLCKADLVSDLVLEFGELQGIAGASYAAHDGEDPAVVRAIRQHYWPRFAGDALPEDSCATCLALADRLDTLVGIFAIGQSPTGSRDPFALRRASLAVLRILVEGHHSVDLRDALALAAAQFPPALNASAAVDTVLAYMLERFRAWFEDEGIATETFRAVQALALSQPLDIQRRVHAVHAFSQSAEAGALAAANKRVANILDKLDEGHVFAEVDAARLQDAAEQALWQAISGVAGDVYEAAAQADYTRALALLAGLRPAVDAFFDTVMVNSEEAALRNNRLNLLRSLRLLFLNVADISQLVIARS
jgi:glycyl-tRNA synthetase beta chain